MWLLLAPRDYLSTFMKVGTIGLLAVGVVIALPTLKMPAVTDFASSGSGPVFAYSMFPFVFITIACGALSGFHSLVSSGTTPKMVQKETQIRMIGYGAMLVESFVAIMAMIAACIIDPGLYFAINAPVGAIGDSVQSASQAVANFGFTISPDALAQAAKDVEETSLLSRTGGAPTFALGMSEIFSAVVGGTAMKAFWYHFAIMFEALFILTTVDALSTRVGRFMLQDMLGNAYKPFREVSWKPGVWFASAVVVGGWGYFLWVGVHDPLGGINQLFPLFGIANQLLAAVALAVCTTLLVKSGRLKWAWVTAVPLAWDVAVTLTASWQKIFSEDVKVGFFAQRDKYQAGIDAGEVLAPREDHGRHADRGHQLHRRRGAERVVRAPHHRGARGRRTGLLQGHPRPGERQAPRDAVRRVQARRPGLALRDQGGEGRAGRRRGRPRGRHPQGGGGDQEPGMTGADVRRVAGRIRWYVRELTGESVYDRYVAHARAHDPEAPVLSRRAFEHARMDAREADPREGFRCC